MTGKPSSPGKPRAHVARNVRNKMSGYAMLGSLPAGCAKLAFFDPQYRGVLDAMAYGNEGVRQKARAGLPAMNDRTIALFVEEIERVLAGSGHMVLWIDKFALGTGGHLRYFAYAPHLKVVDLIHWNKVRIGMGRRARCRSEYAIVAQKLPIRAKGCWTDHRLEDAWIEHADRAVHAHAKPYQLTERLIRATTKRGDLVVDPCAGGYGVLDACKASGRQFVGCDLI